MLQPRQGGRSRVPSSHQGGVAVVVGCGIRRHGPPEIVRDQASAAQQPVCLAVLRRRGAVGAPDVQTQVAMPGAAHVAAQPVGALFQGPVPPEPRGFTELAHERARSQAHQPMRNTPIASISHATPSMGTAFRPSARRATRPWLLTGFGRRPALPSGRIPRLWSTEQASAGLALSMPWLEQLRKVGQFPDPDIGGTDPRWDERRLLAWLHRLQVEAGRRGASVQDVRLLALALAGVPRRELGVRAGFRGDAVSPRLQRAALSVVLAVPAEVRAELIWCGPRDARRPSGGAGVSRSLARLVVDGTPRPDDALPDRRLEWVRRHWAEGRPLRGIADDCGVSASALRQALEAAGISLAPERWGSRRVAEHLGWTVDNVRGRLHSNTFPDADGHEGTRLWWWPHTVEAWAEQHLPHRCAECGARVAQLPQHQRRHASA